MELMKKPPLAIQEYLFGSVLAASPLLLYFYYAIVFVDSVQTYLFSRFIIPLVLSFSGVLAVGYFFQRRFSSQPRAGLKVGLAASVINLLLNPASVHPLLIMPHLTGFVLGGVLIDRRSQSTNRS
jgi:hypothetical protein